MTITSWFGTDTYFMNYATPLVRGETYGPLSSSSNPTPLYSLLEQKLGAIGTTWGISGDSYVLRLPAPGLEMKSGVVPGGSVFFSDAGSRDARFCFSTGVRRVIINSNNSPNTVNGNQLSLGGTNNIFPQAADVSFAIINDYAIALATFRSAQNWTLSQFKYLGWLKDSPFVSQAVVTRQVTAITISQTQSFQGGIRPLLENNTIAVNYSLGNNSITNPPISCGGDVTDIIMRDATEPNYAIGKLWHCVSLPPEAEQGQIWKNNGPDLDGYPQTSNTNKYLVICPWGGRKLGMRIWTEGFE